MGREINMIEENKKQIADHHDNLTRLNVQTENINDDYKYTRDKVEREILYLKTSWDRVVDMKISNYDKTIDLEIFFLKLFIPIFGISFTAGVNIVGIDTHTLKWLSFSIIVLVGLLLTVSFIFRKRIINSEQKNYEKEFVLIRKELKSDFENLKTRTEQIAQNLKLALENEPNL